MNDAGQSGSTSQPTQPPNPSDMARLVQELQKQQQQGTGGSTPARQSQITVDGVIQAALGDARPYYFGAALSTLVRWGPGYGVEGLEAAIKFLTVLKDLEAQQTQNNEGSAA